MAITPIPPYPVPPESELPEPLVGWRPEPARAALLVHDMQRYFLAPYQPLRSPAAELVANIGRLAGRARALGMPVLYTAQPGAMTPRERGLLHDFWGPGMSGDPADTAIVDGLEPEPGDTVLTKWRYSAFVGSDLERRLDALDRDQLIVCGVYAHVGCLMTACDAFSRDIETFFVSDAVADFTEEYHRLAVRYAAERCAVATSTGRLLAALAPVGAEPVS
ncbi:isochorismatase family protein [Actinomadura fibrosa]|uniref:Isochorismatase family protein n=1 Tax=Actinomadura fibrosa TaxID=111802 RepID=A0ABW2XWN6_9ACTN|nr:isochorismatase family protein [Actinomadura fibrosa]